MKMHTHNIHIQSWNLNLLYLTFSCIRLQSANQQKIIPLILNRQTTHTYTRLTALFPRIPRWAGTNLDSTEARDSEWQWHQLGCMQVCTSLQTDNHASTPPLSFLQAGCPSCRPTNSVNALKAINRQTNIADNQQMYWKNLRKHSQDV